MRKKYLAKVWGKFPSLQQDNDDYSGCCKGSSLPSTNDLARWKWIGFPDQEDNECLSLSSITSDRDNMVMMLQVDASIETVDPANGIRRITSKGKPSTSRFHLLEYDSVSDTSIVQCVPVTGRSHQLRVHLEWLGHSIVNDIQYGGGDRESNSDSSNNKVKKMKLDLIDPMAGMNCMLESIREQNHSEKVTPSKKSSSNITLEQEQAALKVCTTCCNGPSQSFSSAQLLQGGHAIFLHAYRYSLIFPVSLPVSSELGQDFLIHNNHSEIIKSNIKNTSEEVTKDSVEAKEADATDATSILLKKIDLKVGLPPWASHLSK